MRRKQRWPFEASQEGLFQQAALLQKKLAANGIEFSLAGNYSALIPGRQFEADVAILEYKIACEYQGGLFMRGRSGHSNVAGAKRDWFKANEAQLNGWLFLQFGPDETRSGSAMNTIERAIELRVRITAMEG